MSYGIVAKLEAQTWGLGVSASPILLCVELGLPQCLSNATHSTELHLIYFLLCECMCVMHACSALCPGRGQSRVSGVSLWHSPPYCLEIGPLVETEAHFWAGLLNVELSGSACRCLSPNAEVTGPHKHVWIFL